MTEPGGGSGFDRLFARALIRWEARIRENWSAGEIKGHRSDFERHLRAFAPREATLASLTDIDARFDWFLDRHGSLTDWYRLLIGPAATGLDWRNQQPLIAPDRVDAWERLLNELDPDALLTFDLADRMGLGAEPQRLAELVNWRTVPRISDHELEVLWSRGVSDLHIHANGVRVPQAVWQELMAERASVETFRDLRRIYAEESRNLHQDVRSAKKHREKLLKGLESRSLIAPPFPVPASPRWWTWSYRSLLQERQMLTAAWGCVTGKTAPLPIRRSGDLAAVSHIRSELEHYLDHKHRFCCLTRQPLFLTTPGLRQFERRYFMALKSKPPRDKWRGLPAPVDFAESPRLYMRPHGNVARYLLETPQLRRLELRITPLDNARASDYRRFFALWGQLKGELDEMLIAQGVARPELPDIRFALHFRRMSDSGQARRPAPPDPLRRLRELDRETAVVRAAFSGAKDYQREAMTSLARLDVAGQERDTPNSLYLTHLMLLRGDTETFERLGEEVFSSPPGDASEPPHGARSPPAECKAESGHEWFLDGCFRRWGDLVRRGEDRPRLGEPRLGLTVHAGEDFTDLLDGLYQVGAAVDGFRMQSGDGIGHALALASDPDPHGLRAAHMVTLPFGAEIDSLCWLLDFVERQDSGGERIAWRHRIRERIKAAATNFCRQESDRNGVDPVLLTTIARAEPDDFLWAWQGSMRPNLRQWRTAHPTQKALLGKAMLLVRHRTTSVDPLRHELDDIVKWAQGALTCEIERRRIVIEMNPGSNLRITAAGALQDSPTVRLFQTVADGLLACVNTDNPGVFSSCIENEYALLLTGAIRAGVPVGKARQWLEDVRRTGMDLVYWPPQRLMSAEKRAL